MDVYSYEQREGVFTVYFTESRKFRQNFCSTFVEKTNIDQKILTIATESLKRKNRSKAVFKSAAPDSLHPRILRAGKGVLCAVNVDFPSALRNLGKLWKKKKSPRKLRWCQY